MSAVASLEKALAINSNGAAQSAAVVLERSAALERMYREQQQRDAVANHPSLAPVNSQQARALVNEMLLERHVGDVDAATMQTAMAQQADALLHQMGSMAEVTLQQSDCR